MRAPIHIGSRRELFVDQLLVDRLDGARQVLQRPEPREAALACDAPWEGCMGAFNTVIQLEDRCRLYYRGWHVDLDDFTGGNAARPMTICVAESTDGIHWQRRPVGRFDYGGCRDNNIVWMGAGDDRAGMHGFAPFLDTNPACPSAERWKAVGGGWSRPHDGLHLMTSPDGLEWALRDAPPFLAGNALDSHNTVLWSQEEGCYRAYFRAWTEGSYTGRRTIATATSPDMREWTGRTLLAFPGAPAEQLYINNVIPCPGAPHLRLGFPARYVERSWSPTIDALPEPEHRRRRAAAHERYGTALTDTVFMASREPTTWRRWPEAFIRPGRRAAGSWAYGDMFPAWGVLETPSALPGGGRELSFYVTEGYWRGEGSTIRRYSLRPDGFVAVNAPLAGGELVTPPVVFAGDRLSLNISTSAAGSARVEMQDAAGSPLPGRGLDDCWDIVGDTTGYTVRWHNGSELAEFAGRPVRLRFVLNDADLYAFQFTTNEGSQP